MRTDSAVSAPLRSLLVIDDEPSICMAIAHIARQARFEVRTICDPRDLDQVYSPTLDVITVDLSMPVMDGIEVLRQLAERGTRASIILVSGFDDKVLQSAFALGQTSGLNMAGHLTKPIRADELLALLEDHDAIRPDERAPGLPESRFSGQEVARAIADGQLVMHFQPHARLCDGALVGLEALVRWQHPTQGLVYPDGFLPLVEAQGLGLPLTAAVIRATLDSLRQYMGRHPALEHVSINLPPACLTDVSFPDQVAGWLRDTGISPQALTFELTETSVAQEAKAALDILTRLRLKGVRLSIDDFGVGYSSLELLQRLPFTQLKVDKQFVLAMERNPGALAIVRRSIDLGQDLGMNVVAEGVETATVWERLVAMGCDLAQGYFICRPMPLPRLIDWLPNWRPPIPGQAPEIPERSAE